MATPMPAQHRLYKSNSSGVSGISWHRRAKSWQIYCFARGRRIYLGYQKDLDKAKEVLTAYTEQLALDGEL